jgi:hypothetical protein
LRVEHDFGAIRVQDPEHLFGISLGISLNVFRT